ncbi:30S ribosomal protein S8 [Candidatus Woesearchaeota archaeon]|nr:30S ribosomal protein S8 [Candidatus Woesearchaeota archaeon]
MQNDILSDALSNIMNSQAKGKKSIRIKPASMLLKKVLSILNENGYIGEVKVEEDSRGNKFEVQLIGTINKCGAIKPRFPAKKDGFEKFEKIFLPARNFGIIIVSTQQGIMTHESAKNKGIGGKLLAYCY